MKPAWEKLEKEFASSTTLVIGNVDCTADDAKPVCEKYGVQGYPTIRYFNSETAANGDDYQGAREFDDLLKFAKSDTFGPKCSDANLALCSDEQKAFLEKISAMTAAERATESTSKNEEFSGIESTFKSEVEKLQAKYQELMSDKEQKETDFKTGNPHLGLLSARVKSD